MSQHRNTASKGTDKHREHEFTRARRAIGPEGGEEKEYGQQGIDKNEDYHEEGRETHVYLWDEQSWTLHLCRQV